MYESSARRPPQPVAYKNHNFTTVSDIWLSDERVTSATWKFAFYHSFRRPTSTKWRKGCVGDVKICISPQFWTSDKHEITRGLRRRPRKFAFHHSFGRPTSTKWRKSCVDDVTICISPQFWTPDKHEITRGLRRRPRKFAFHHSFGRPTSTR